MTSKKATREENAMPNQKDSDSVPVRVPRELWRLLKIVAAAREITTIECLNQVCLPRLREMIAEISSELAAEGGEGDGETKSRGKK